MSFPAHTSPNNDPRKIFFELEDDILAAVEYVAIIASITRTGRLELTKDEASGLHRLVLQLEDHAIAIRDGFRKASHETERGRT